ncbi:exodeoxyribonuclease III [Microvirga antarctica]|uniref:exodeoxyribonuclease III n=1 Tax=Microvirga antarctica TaxID=2819233 RepID=UPI001B305B00|nr:exodeoxyribonuclease III [Microvirga antarctica]
MRIATWNVNSIKQRLEHLGEFLKTSEPDVVCLQELKCTDDTFPRSEVEGFGYHVETHGQKAYNGVAILSKRKLEDVRVGLPGDDGDDHARYIEGVIATEKTALRVASIYLPNGNPITTPKFAYKLAWMERLSAHARALLKHEENLVLCGDFNVIPDPKDAADPALWVNDALFQPETRASFRALLDLGFADALRACSDEGGLYTFWDYQAGAYQRNNGIRIDHFLLSPQAQDKLRSVAIRKDVRGWEKPSDHVPVMIDLDIEP